MAILGGFGATVAVIVSQFSRDNLRSARGIDYMRLKDLLKAQNWSEADRTTRQLLLKLCSRDPSDAWRLANGQWDENIFRQDIDQISCTDLLTIDQLWVKYSNGRFGFSIQKNIYLDVGGKLDGEKHETEWDKFAIAIGWKQINYNLDNMI